MAVQRRKLAFASLAEVVVDAENLLAKGYDKAGNWDLAQVCGHLSEWLRFPIEGFPKFPLLLRPFAWLFRVTKSKAILAKILADGFPAQARTVPETVPLPGGDPAAAVAKLRDAVVRYATFDGERHPSPLFGKLDQETATRVQLLHAAHHLSFLVPRPA